MEGVLAEHRAVQRFAAQRPTSVPGRWSVLAKTSDIRGSDLVVFRVGRAVVSHCREFNIMNKLLNMLGTRTKDTLIKNLLEAIVTISSCFSGQPEELSTLIDRASVDTVRAYPGSLLFYMERYYFTVITSIKKALAAGSGGAALSKLRIGPGMYYNRHQGRHNIARAPITLPAAAWISLYE